MRPKQTRILAVASNHLWCNGKLLEKTFVNAYKNPQMFEFYKDKNKFLVV